MDSAERDAAELGFRRDLCADINGLACTPRALLRRQATALEQLCRYTTPGAGQRTKVQCDAAGSRMRSLGRTATVGDRSAFARSGVRPSTVNRSFATNELPTQSRGKCNRGPCKDRPGRFAACTCSKPRLESVSRPSFALPSVQCRQELLRRVRVVRLKGESECVRPGASRLIALFYRQSRTTWLGALRAGIRARQTSSARMCWHLVSPLSVCSIPAAPWHCQAAAF
jgi:hypothetical protein